ncbi:uracil-DNA glycosylase [Thauera sp.]|jgi:DNA polymerase|uniref:uracil-DNA glycosylase n=1 Tax=Thauera sp. TaxID=1905334 RepID=UPI002A361390|nr:uracil-DNA glycosylase [Thauera sp.]MDX9886294.1 uracil-DNA glycosylase [Thauera sp.]
MAARISTWRAAALREMGLGPIWLKRGSHEQEPFVPEATAPTQPAAEPPPAKARNQARSLIPSAPGPAPAAMAVSPAAASVVAHSVAVPERKHARQPSPPQQFLQPDDGERLARIETLDWAALEDDIRACRACSLCERRKQAVPGVGDRQARWMFVGEGPGAEEDQRGEPFVGQAGRLLDNMLAALGLDRTQDVYIANAVKCRPPHNRTPERVELAACLPYLDRQIALVKPRLLVALGRPAAQALLDRELAISAARGKRFERQGIPVVVTYHPAYLLRNPQDKAKAWEDLCFARRMMAGEA